MSDDKPRYPAADALAVAHVLLAELEPACSRIAVAGSLRRQRPTVGDVELVYVSREVPQARGPGDLFGDERTLTQAAELRIAELIAARVLAMRPNAKGQVTFGPRNKLLVHCATGIPVDLFATQDECWFNYLVCRTGGAEHNRQICLAAHAKGWKWTPYGPGFSRGDGEIYQVRSERDLYDFLGLPYIEPEQRP
jgi:DNA polymerase (family 10)